jgi:orotidine-5'-phosphate decarboxylase
MEYTMPTESIIDAILDNNFTEAGEEFESELASRISDVLDAKRADIGSQMGFGAEPEEEPVEAEA